MNHELSEDQSASYSSADPAIAKITTIVGIGASAGGLEALEAFFTNIPKESGCAFIIVQHLPHDRKSLMPEILTRHSRLVAREVQDGEEIGPDRIYLAPPGYYVRLERQIAKLTKIPATDVNSWPINMLFTSLARELGDRAIVVVLSGSGSDGMRGCEAVREQNGLVLVQDQETAAFDGMPRSATLVADLVLPPADLASSLLGFVQREPSAQTPVQERESRERGDNAKVRAILDILAGRHGVTFNDYKSEMIVRRIERRSAMQGFANLDGYADLLASNDLELSCLFKDLLIGVTGFFRDEQVFARLAEIALPKLVENVGPANPFRCWVAGCATGEEAYSMAIVIYEALAAAGRPINFNVFATDVFDPALEIASRGDYEAGQLSSMSLDRLTRFFSPRVNGYQVSSLLRRHVIFARHDLMRDVAFRRLDLVSCRNVLIYFNAEAQNTVLTGFERSLNDDGVLVLGSSENVGNLGQSLIPLDGRARIFRKRLGGDRRFHGKAASTPISAMPQYIGVHPSINRGSVADSDINAAYDALLQRYIKAGVLIDQQGEILHNFGNIDRYFRIPVGRMRSDITMLIRPELRTPLQAGINSALRERREVAITNVQVGDNDDLALVELRIEALPERPNGAQHLLVSIAPIELRLDGADDEPLTAKTSRELLLSRLEAELDDTRGNLRMALQQLETNNEELQSSNEELIAGNEELQVTNEELHTINAEHSRKIGELEQLNADIENLLGSLSQGVLFIDPELRLRRCNPAAIKLLEIGPTDIGTTLRRLPSCTLKAFIIEHFAATLAGQDSSKVVELADRQYLLQMLCGRNADGIVDGVLVSFTDASEIIGLNRRVHAAGSALSRALQSLPHPVALYDSEQRLTMFNEAYAQLYATLGDRLTIGTTYEAVARLTAENGLAPEAVGRTEEWLAERLVTARERKPVDTVLMRAGSWYRFIDHPLPDGGTLVMRFHVADFQEQRATPDPVDPAMIKRLAILEPVFEGSANAKLVVDRTTRLTTVNSAFAQLSGESGEALTGRLVDEVGMCRDAGIAALVQTVLQTGEPILDCSLALRTGAAPTTAKPYRARLLPAWMEGQLVAVSVILQPVGSEGDALFGVLPGLLKLLERDRVGLAFINRQVRFVEVNRDMAEIDGVAVEAHTGKSITEILPDAKALRQAFRREVIAKAEFFTGRQMDLVLPAHPLEVRGYEVSLVPQRDAKGKVEGAHMILVPLQSTRTKPASAARRAKRG